MTSPDRPPLVPLSSSPAPSHSRSYSASVPRSDATARLATPVPATESGTPPINRRAAVIRDASTSSNNSPGQLSPLPGGAGTVASGPGVSALAAALSNSLGTSPPRFGTPPARVSTPPGRPLSPPPGFGTQRSGTPTNYGSFDSRRATYEDPEVVKRHLVQPGDTGSDEGEASVAGGKGKQPADAGAGMADGEFSSLQLQGGDTTRGIYKWTEDAEARQKVQRSKSFILPRPEPETETLDITSIKVPGGFRRNYIRRAAGDGDPSMDIGQAEEGGTASPQPKLITSSFLEFLSLYGHFAGEELEGGRRDSRTGRVFQLGTMPTATRTRTATLTANPWRRVRC